MDDHEQKFRFAEMTGMYFWGLCIRLLPRRARALTGMSSRTVSRRWTLTLPKQGTAASRRQNLRDFYSQTRRTIVQ